MNCENHSRIMCLEYEMLSTGLFTKARNYPSWEHGKKANNDAVFARFWRSAAIASLHAPEALVDKFFSRRGRKSAGRENSRFDKKSPGKSRGGRGGGGRRSRGGRRLFLHDGFFAFDVGLAALALLNLIGLCSHISLHYSRNRVFYVLHYEELVLPIQHLFYRGRSFFLRRMRQQQ
ncbi:MAG: hypothetical protein ACLQVY_24685 [Limisphaerales bacterium]